MVGYELKERIRIPTQTVMFRTGISLLSRFCFVEPLLAFKSFVVIEYVLQPAGYFKTLYSRLLTSETPRFIPFPPCVNPTVVRLRTLSPLCATVFLR
jgi:hypothetical protein